jgi:hypothetical protein
VIALTAARVPQGLGGAMMVPVGRLALFRSVEKTQLIANNGLSASAGAGLDRAAGVAVPPKSATAQPADLGAEGDEQHHQCDNRNSHLSASSENPGSIAEYHCRQIASVQLPDTGPPVPR